MQLAKNKGKNNFNLARIRLLTSIKAKLQMQEVVREKLRNDLSSAR